MTAATSSGEQGVALGPVAVRKLFRDQRTFLLLVIVVAIGVLWRSLRGAPGSGLTGGAVLSLWLAGAVWAAIVHRDHRYPRRGDLLGLLGVQNVGIQLLLVMPVTVIGVARLVRASSDGGGLAFASNAFVTVLVLPLLGAVVLTFAGLAVAIPVRALLGRKRGGGVTALVMFALVCVGQGGANAVPAQECDRPMSPTTLQLDHVSIAVRDLDAARRRFADDLGFALKPGRTHPNSLENLHVKFSEGTELELITATEPRDNLARNYLRFLEGGDGGAFLALHAGPLEQVAEVLEVSGYDFRKGSGVLSQALESRLGYVFFGTLQRSPTDRPEHFEHANGAYSLAAVWLRGGDLDPELELLASLGARPCGQVTLPGIEQDAVRVPLHGGALLLLPAAAGQPGDRRITGVTMRVRDIDQTARRLRLGASSPEVTHHDRGSSVVLPPSVGQGIWLELLEEGEDDTRHGARIR